MKHLTVALVPVLMLGVAGIAEAGPKAERKARVEQRVQMRIDKMDTNKDGNISRDEAMAASMKRFDEFDLNGDGQITPQERKEAKVKIKAEWKAKRAEKTPT